MNEMTLLTIFIGVTAIAVLLQMLILAGIGVAVLKLSKSVESMQAKVNEQVLPVAAQVRTLVDQTAPKVQSLVDESIPMLQKAVTNLTESTAVVRAQADKIDGVVTHVVELARNQADRVDVLATRTLERVDVTAATVQQTVTSPFRRASALLEGVVAGVGSLVGRHKGERAGKTASGEQMFI